MLNVIFLNGINIFNQHLHFHELSQVKRYKYLISFNSREKVYFAQN